MFFSATCAFWILHFYNEAESSKKMYLFLKEAYSLLCLEVLCMLLISEIGRQRNENISVDNIELPEFRYPSGDSLEVL